MIEWALVGVFKVHLYLSNLFISLALTKLAFKWFDLETNECGSFKMVDTGKSYLIIIFGILFILVDLSLFLIILNFF
jgi:hypothetical protein